MSQPRKLDKKLCLDKSKQKSFVLKGKRKSSSMQSFTEKVGFNGGGKWYLSLVFLHAMQVSKIWRSSCHYMFSIFQLSSFYVYIFIKSKNWLLNNVAIQQCGLGTEEESITHSNPKTNLSMRTLVFCTYGGMTRFLPSRTAPLKPMFRWVGCLEEGASGGGCNRWVILFVCLF